MWLMNAIELRPLLFDLDAIELYRLYNDLITVLALLSIYNKGKLVLIRVKLISKLPYEIHVFYPVNLLSACTHVELSASSTM